MTKEELKEKIIDRINYGKFVATTALEAQGQKLKNCDVRIMTVYCGEDPIASLRYELEGEKLKIWVTKGNGGDEGFTGVPQCDTFQERLEIVCEFITNIISQLVEEYVINWLGD